MLERKRFNSREEWLDGRQVGIGASEASIVCGLSPWMSSSELFKLKTGRQKRKDVQNEAVSIGVRLEPVLRDLYQATHPNATIEYNQFDILYQEDRPWLFATLDGEINGNEILEIKTSTPRNKAAWEEWNDRIPDHYYCQILHQMLATGYEKATLYAALFDFKGQIHIREYNFVREECEADMDIVLKQEIAFHNSVVNDKIPATRLVL